MKNTIGKGSKVDFRLPHDHTSMIRYGEIIDFKMFFEENLIYYKVCQKDSNNFYIENWISEKFIIKLHKPLIDIFRKTFSTKHDKKDFTEYCFRRYTDMHLKHAKKERKTIPFKNWINLSIREISHLKKELNEVK